MPIPGAGGDSHGRTQGGQRKIDAWGVVWERTNEETFGEAVQWPFAEVTRHRERGFPEMNDPRYYNIKTMQAVGLK